ncbi:hypothetical protein BDV19DRAFT_396444 [Aspergillus venezuelensis]
MSPRYRPCESYGYPTCSRCAKHDRECRRVETKWRFRHAVPLGFVDETPKYTDPRPAPSSTPPANARISNGTPLNATTASSPQIPAPIPFNFHSSPSSTLAYSPRHHQSIYTSPHSRHLSTSASSPKTSSVQSIHTAWPNLTPRDACLLRYFIEDLSRWFDLTDPQNHFATVIPQRARSCPTLLDALLAVSARHFSTLPIDQKEQILSLYGFPRSATSNPQDTDLEINEETVLHYHNRCITELRRLAYRSEAVMNEDLLAAVVALRFFEELDNPFTTPTETALQGLHVFLSAQASSALSHPGQRQASFWIGYRQEFNLALSQQRVTRLPIDLVRDRYLHFNDAEDHVWTNRLIVIGTLVLRHCYGNQDDKHGSPSSTTSSPSSKYEGLIQLQDKWMEKRPRSFAPMYIESKPNDIFPKIYFMDDAHIVAAQTLALLNILLLACSPHVPKLGPNRKSTMESIDSQIRSIVLEICGMALSNRQSRPAGLTACIAINLCADRFTDIAEQKALMGLVKGTTQDSNYWPTGGLEGWLRGVWGWDCEE